HREAAHHHAGAFGREVLGIVKLLEMRDRHAGDPLQRLGDAAVRQLADVGGDDAVDDLLGVALDRLRGHDAGALRRHDDFLDALALALVLVLVLVRLPGTDGRTRHDERDGGGRRESTRPEDEPLLYPHLLVHHWLLTLPPRGGRCCCIRIRYPACAGTASHCATSRHSVPPRSVRAVTRPSAARESAQPSL